MGLRELKAELKKQNKETLIKHISELYTKFKPVKEYFDFYFNPNEEDLLEKYKEKVREGFYPKYGWDLKLSISRKAINDFKKLGPSPEYVVDLLLYYVECGVEFTNEFGDIDESFYISIGNTFTRALELMEKELLFKKFKDRCENILDDASGIGWGFYDYLVDSFYQFYRE